ncbi:MAG: Ig-like domain-containing protein [Clostridia bacterium]|nr:Ig-like domain-containing protein [Clostridia bacterium]
MKAKKKAALKISVFLMAVLLIALSLTVIMASASETVEVMGEMTDIKTKFSSYLAQDTVRVNNDGYVGDYQYTAYYDTSKGDFKPGYEGTPVVVYTINHPKIARIGTDSNETIIKSMLDRGYAVVVLDYLNQDTAVSPAIANSTQNFRTQLINGKILTNTAIFPTGNIRENFLAPSGYNVLLNEVFWEIDKHSAEGTLEKIVENWNSDFRATKGTKLLKWVHTDGTRKAVQNDFDGNAPVWYDASGKVDASGEYTYVKFTKAETVTDCVDPDGSFIDMNLYINIVYPTSPANKVPVMSLANSSGHPTTSVTGADLRPHSNDFLYNGYANVVFDYLWEPMARSASWGYYDGSGGVTKDHMNYALMMYNDKLVNTAAMRYLRYISLSGGNTYNFDLNAFGVYGNSKGGWFAYLGEKNIQSALVDATKYETTEELEHAISIALENLVPDRYYEGHHGETRYSVGAGAITADGFTVKAGEKQPWLTYGGVEIISGVQFTNPCNGSQQEDITEGHAPMFISGNMTDTYNAAFGYSNDIYNICRELNIPILQFEVPIGHTLTSGMDMNYNLDTYDAYFRYVNYFLKGDAISVAYISPMPNAGGVKVTDKITIGFAGKTTLAEIEKITVTAGDTAVSGSWESSCGGVVWTFIPNALSGNTEYTITIPTDFAGANGKAIGTAYTTSFITEFDKATAAAASGNYYTLTAPAMTSGNSFVFRFNVTNDAANIAELYAVSEVGATDGTLLGSINLRGAGSYEIDITDYIAANAGNEIVLLLKGAKAAGTTNVLTETFDSSKPSSTNSKVTYTTGAVIDGEKTLGAVVTTPTANGVSVYYSNVTHIFTYPNVTGGQKTTAENYGRRYTIAFDVYDTTERVLQLKLNWMTNRTGYGTIDYNHVIRNVKTTANGWTHVEFTYDVYEPDYGFPSANNTQSLAVYVSPDGDTNAPVYFNDLIVNETVTDITVGGAVVAEKNDGTGAYSAPVSTSPFAIYNGDSKIAEYASWANVLSAYTSGYTIKLQRDYTLTDADLSDKLGGFSAVNLDLGTYTITCENTSNSLFWAKATSTSATAINITGGAIRLGRTALVSYEGATSAGSGKVFNINLYGTYVGFAPNAWATELISDIDTTSGVKISSNINLTDCTLDFPEASHSKDAALILPAPATASLNVNYTLTGGVIKLSSERWITILDNAKIAEFVKTSDGSYTKLIMPESITVPVSGSYMLSDGYAAYTKASATDNMATYTLTKGDNSTKYGIITETYKDADTYPILLFKDGVLVSAHTTLASAIAGANSLLGSESYANSQAEILLRKSMENTAEPTYGNTAGTLLIDLGGNTLTRNKVIINAVVTSTTPMFETNVIFTNGRLETPANVMGVTHCLYTTENVKTFNFTFDNVTFGFASGATGLNAAFWTIWQNGHTTVIDTNINLKNCTFDLKTNKPAKTGSLFAVNTAAAECDVVIEGGEIIGDGSGITLVNTDSKDSVLLKKDAEGNYLKFTPSSGGTPVIDNFLCDDGVYRNFQATDNGYELKENDLVTPYGVITSTYADAQDYPFVVFKENGTLIGGYKYFYGVNGGSSAWGAAKEYVKSNKFNVDTGKFTVNTYKAYIVMRRDYTFQTVTKSDGTQVSEYTDNFAQVRGEITLDLGGNTLIQDSNSTQSLFNAHSKRWETVTNAAGETVDYTFPSIYNIKNGTIKANTTSIIKHSVASSSSALKVFTFNFDNVKFGLTEGATTTNLLTSYGSSNYAAGLKINLNGCTFDLNTVKPTVAITLLNVNNTPAKINTDITVENTKFLIDDLTNITFSGSKGSGVSLKFIDTKNVPAATLITLSANTPNTTYFRADDGNRYFVEHIDDGTTATYYLDSLTTPYGTVPHSTITANPEYLSAVTYPFLLFMDGAFKRVDDTWALAISHVKDYAKGSASAAKTVEIVLRRDYSVQKAAPRANGTTADDTTWNLLYMIGGTMKVDLNGYTLIRKDKPILDISSKTDETLAYKTTIIFINGDILVSGGQIMGVDHGGITAETVKVWDITYENVTMSYAEGATTKNMVAATWTSGKGYSTLMNLKLNNCVLDLTYAPTGVTIVNASDNRTNGSAGTVDYTTTINGCKLIGYASVPTMQNSNNGDVIRFGKYNGEYFAVELPSTVAHPANTFTAENGKSLTFAKESAADGYILYRLGEAISTKYGDIPYRYHSITDYPFVVFGENKNFVGADDTFLDITDSYDNDGAFNAAKGYLVANVWDGTSYGASPRAAFILMRRDYAMAANEQYNNIAQVQGLLTLDLGGFELTAPKDKPLFGATIKPWSGSGDLAIFPSEFNIIGGDIVLQNKALIKFDAWTGAADRADDYVANKTFNFTFEDVNVKVIGNTANLSAEFGKSNTPDAIGNTFVNFINCTFDITAAKDGIVLFGIGSDTIDNNVTVTGGEILAGDTTFAMYQDIAENGASLLFAKENDANYTALTLASGLSAPDAEFLTALGNAVFVKVEDGTNTVTYRLRLTELANIEFAPKMSLTLDRDLIFNVYIPEKSLVKFTLDGVDYDNLTAIDGLKTDIDGENYYLVSIPLAAKDATRTIKLTATVSVSEEKTATSVYSFNIVKYAEKILAGNNEIESQLMRDVLSYVRSAYVYFKASGNDDVIAKIGEILGDSYDDNNAPVMNGSSDTPEVGLKSATFILSSTPTIRFYVAEDADVSTYSFYADGVGLKTESGENENGKYIDIDVYAYRMCETITYKIGGTESGSFHIKAYYEWAKTQNDDALVNVVARFAKYCESAKAYKNSVT